MEGEYQAAINRMGSREVSVEEREALRVAEEWTGGTTWTNGSHLEDGRVGAAAVWWGEAHTPSPWMGEESDRWRFPHSRLAEWPGRRYHLRSNEEDHNA